MLLYNGRIRVCLDPPARRWDPRPQVGRNPPAPGPASAARWDPNPRWAARSGRRRPAQGFGRGDPAEARGEAGVCPSRAGAWHLRAGWGSGAKKGRNPSRFFRGASEMKRQGASGTVWRGNSLITRKKMAHPARFELTTSAFGGQHLRDHSDEARGTSGRAPLAWPLSLLAQKCVHLGCGKRGIDISEGAVFPHFLRSVQ
jgi:hypothetical protein